MDYRIVEKRSFTVAGKAVRVSTRDGENLRRIPQFWEECLHDGAHERLAALAASGNTLGNVTLGICMDFTPNMEEFTYMIAAEAADGDVPDGMIGKSIPALTWAVFEAQGAMPDAIQTVWSRIWSEFFPSMQFKHAEGPDLELYPSGDPTQSDYRFEVWVPVVKQEGEGNLEETT
jgi:AraC family transcriptional regulator